jgi:diguanylate cyclase (GGDEF)-like protein
VVADGGVNTGTAGGNTAGVSSSDSDRNSSGARASVVVEDRPACSLSTGDADTGVIATGTCDGSIVALLSAGSWLAVNIATRCDTLVLGIEVVNLTVLLVTFVLFGQMLAALRARLDRERLLAHTDPLTGIHNRRAFWSAAARELERCRRRGEPFSLAYLDLDAFKAVNDRYGHRAGDELLRGIATTLQQDLRQLDMVARLGGDEFALLLPGANVHGASAALLRLRERLHAASWRKAFDIDFSLGCLTVLTAPADVDTVVAQADELMYEMKRSGRGQTLHRVLRDELLFPAPQVPPPPVSPLRNRTAN